MKYITILIGCLLGHSLMAQSNVGVTKKDSVSRSSGDIKIEDNTGRINVTGHVGGSITTNLTINYANDTTALQALDSIRHDIKLLTRIYLKKEQEYIKKINDNSAYFDSLKHIRGEVDRLISINEKLSRDIDSLVKMTGLEVKKVKLVPYTCPDCKGSGTMSVYEECYACNGGRLIKYDPIGEG